MSFYLKSVLLPFFMTVRHTKWYVWYAFPSKMCFFSLEKYSSYLWESWPILPPLQVWTIDTGSGLLLGLLIILSVFIAIFTRVFGSVFQINAKCHTLSMLHFKNLKSLTQKSLKSKCIVCSMFLISL